MKKDSSHGDTLNSFGRPLFVFYALLAFFAFSNNDDVRAQTGRNADMHVELIVVNGSGSGTYYAYEQADISASAPASDFTFIQWIKIEGDGSIANRYSPNTVFNLGKQDAKVVAVFAKLETWFPPGPEDNTKGILLPKSSGSDTLRMEHKVRITTNQGGEENVSYKNVFDLVRVRFEWNEEGHASYFDAQEAGNSINSGGNLPNLKFEEESDGEFCLSMWYEGTQEPPSGALPEKVEASLQLIANNKDIGQKLTASLLPFELISDLNNNGKIDGGDRTLKSDGAKSDATDEQKETATEYIFANDNVSNGAWDKDDPSSDKPQDATDDDDAEEISLTCAVTWGAVWFEHPAIAKMSFYRTKECKQTPADKLTFPFALSDQESGKLPEKVYVRLDGNDFTEQAVGDLVMKFGKADKSETWAEDKIKFTAIKQLGDEKFFQAARDYILERNTELFAHNWGYPVANPTTFIRMCIMREEATTMHPIETFHYIPDPHAPPDPVQYGLAGIESVMAHDASMTVVINGNTCAFSDGKSSLEAYTLFLIGSPVMTDRCQGRIIVEGAQNPASSDHYDRTTNAPGTSMKGSELAGPDPIPETGGPGGKYFAQFSDGNFTMGAGRLPSGATNGLGGLSSSYKLINQFGINERPFYPNSMVGYAPMNEDGKGVVFVACGIDFVQGNGKIDEFYQASRDSGIPDISGATDSNGMTVVNLLLLDSGDTSPGLAHKNASGTHKLILKGTKHDGNKYFINTYLRFKAELPREETP